MTAPRYQDIEAEEIPEVTDDDGTQVRVITGDFWGQKGPVEATAADQRYLDVFVPPGKRKHITVDRANRAFAYVFAGSGTFRDASDPAGVINELTNRRDTPAAGEAGNRSLVQFDQGDEIVVQAGDQGIRFLLVSGKPIEEPVAWYGPVVMNTEEEIRQAFAELRTGTFIR
jgi:redox-sensitive bicupin YhaK (pirin superfamily)